ncbi:hypothetical protein GCM10027203_19830 [Nonomuraea fastidiosa]
MSEIGPHVISLAARTVGPQVIPLPAPHGRGRTCFRSRFPYVPAAGPSVAPRPDLVRFPRGPLIRGAGNARWPGMVSRSGTLVADHFAAPVHAMREGDPAAAPRKDSNEARHPP